MYKTRIEKYILKHKTFVAEVERGPLNLKHAQVYLLRSRKSTKITSINQLMVNLIAKRNRKRVTHLRILNRCLGKLKPHKVEPALQVYESVLGQRWAFPLHPEVESDHCTLPAIRQLGCYPVLTICF